MTSRQLTESQRARLADRIARARREAAVTGSNSESSGAGEYPLSPAQEQLWFLTSLNPEAAAGYAIALSLPIAGRVNAATLSTVISTLLRRHAALRTVFRARQTGVVQVVCDALPFELTVDNIEGPEEIAQDALAATIRADEAVRPFDLVEGPLFRARLIRFSADRHELLLAFHHIIADGWSVGIFVRELSQLYGADAALELPPIPIQYGAYSARQREQLNGSELDRLLDYWRPLVAGAPTLELPCDYVRPSARSFRGANVRAVLPRGLSSSLRQIAQDERATLFMTLLAAFKVCLFRVTGENDLVIGTAVANRSRSDIESVIGLFVNSLVIHSQLRPSMTFREVIGELRSVCLDAYDHQDLPFEKLVRECAPERAASKNPIFQVVFNLIDSSQARLEAGGVQFGPLRGLSQTTRFDLEVHVIDTGDELSVDFVYSTDLFESATMHRLLSRYERTLEALAADPLIPIEDLVLVSANERADILAAGTGAVSETDGTLAERFSAVAAARPNAIAIEDGDTRLTYETVAARARRLAAALQNAGIGPNDVVGVWLERGADLITTIVGIVLSGGAYLPIEPSQPLERAAMMLEEANVKVVLTTSALASTLPAGSWRVMTIDSASEGAANIVLRGLSSDLAYVLYTSGSTGRPKGVAIPQQAVLRLVLTPDYVRLGPGKVIGQAATAAFDAATFEIWGAFLHGATLVVIPTAVVVSPAALSTFVRRTGITTMFLTAALAHQIGREAPGALASLETLLVGGDALEPRWIAAIQDAGSPQHLVNAYGPTETTTFAAWFPIDHVPANAATIPIGGPITDTQTYILDTSRDVVPIGVPGELYIGGVGLACGYVNAARLTAERFVPDGVTGAFGARLYKTGDMVAWQRPGCIRFIGRRDGQIKLRGNRIELGEIESALAAIPDVGAAVVAVHGVGDERRLIGYVIPRPGAVVTAAAIREALRGRIPGYMVPSSIGVLSAFPLNANGKIDRKALPAPDKSWMPGSADVAPRTARETLITRAWQKVLGMSSVGVNDNFFDIGGHSLLLMRLQAELETTLEQHVPLMALFQYPTVGLLAAHLEGAEDSAITTRASEFPVREPIAIIGLAGRFPGAADVDEFWSNLRNGVETISRFTADELVAAGVPPESVADPQFVPARGALTAIDEFDAELFGYSPRDAALLDPQHRLFLECAWQALEQAGYAPTQPGAIVGVYAGTSANSYIGHVGGRAFAGAGALQVLVAGDKDFLATRVSYKLNLKGPALTIQTACSTSLVAVHAACQALRSGDCEVALAGGVSVTVPSIGGYRYVPEGIASPDGRCRPFDAQAAGTVSGNGAGVVVLKPLARAIADGNYIHAVIRGSAVNNDGADKVGFTAPSIGGQATVVANAQAAAGVASGAITYVEAHGTGTRLGDPIEVTALRQVFGEGNGPATCALGSVKSNVGHLDAAAGVTGLIKTVLALHHREIPPTLHFTAPNPELQLGPFYVPTAVTPWHAPTGEPRRAGVSSFGMGGTNVHVIVEEAPTRTESSPAREWHVLPVSGESEDAANANASRLAEWLDHNRDVCMADVAYSQQVGRAALRFRRAAIGRSGAELASSLRSVVSRETSASPVALVWMFPGQGTQLVGMARALYETEPIFRAEIDACAAALGSTLGGNLCDVLYPPRDSDRDAAERLSQTSWTQVSLVSVQLALAALWRHWGVRPTAVVGHSVGEISAACVAGVLTRESAVQLAAARGTLMQSAPPGGMTAVAAAVEKITPHLPDGVWLAAENSETQCVVSGALEPLAQFESWLSAQGVRWRRLAAAGAFHSGLMHEVVAPLRARAAEMPHRTPDVSWISTVTATAQSADAPVDPNYWGHQVTAPVQWRRAIDAARATVGTRVAWLELGPGHTLSHLVRRCDDEIVLTTMDGDDAVETHATALAALWAHGVRIDWRTYHEGASRHVVPLPTYQFQRKRHWLSSEEPAHHHAPRAAAKDPDVGRWLYVPCWKQTPAPRVGDRSGAHAVIFSDAEGCGEHLATALKSKGMCVTVVNDRAADFTALIGQMDATAAPPVLFVHCLSVTASAEPVSETENRDALQVGYYSLLSLAQAIARRPARVDSRIVVVSSGAQSVLGEEPVCPAKAAGLALCTVISQEHPSISCRSIDIDWEHRNDLAAIDAVAEDVSSNAVDRTSAWRRGRRWVRTFERVPASATDHIPLRLREGATYLITGGLGRIGLAVARHLAGACRPTLLLVSRSPLPAQSLWDTWTKTHAGDAATVAKIRALQAIEAAGARVCVIDADIADRARLYRALEEAEQRFGPVRGVIHAAGATTPDDFQELEALGRDCSERQFRSKIYGTLALHELFASRRLDFCLAMSSISSVVGGIGFGAYAAANAFMDSLAESTTGTPLRWTSALWDGWTFDATGAREVNRNARTAINPDEGIEAFDRILNVASSGSIVVSPVDLGARLTSAAPTARTSIHHEPLTSTAPRPRLSSSYREPGTDVERIIARAWGEALGIGGIGAEDNFFELGGHSLLAVELLSGLSASLHVKLQLRHLWEAPTVAALARRAEGLGNVDTSIDSRVTAALESIHSMSEEEVERLLAEAQGSVN